MHGTRDCGVEVGSAAERAARTKRSSLMSWLRQKAQTARHALGISLLVSACGATPVPVIDLPIAPKGVHFGMREASLLAARPRANYDEYAGVLEVGGTAGVEEISYHFRPAKPRWIQRSFGRLTRVDVATSSSPLFPPVRDALVRALGRPDASWCEVSPSEPPSSETRVLTWKGVGVGAQSVEYREFGAIDSVTGSFIERRTVVSIAADQSDVRQSERSECSVVNVESRARLTH